jgi:hypothetical protein
VFTLDTDLPTLFHQMAVAVHPDVVQCVIQVAYLTRFNQFHNRSNNVQEGRGWELVVKEVICQPGCQNVTFNVVCPFQNPINERCSEKLDFIYE